MTAPATRWERAMLVAWPGFIAALVAEFVFFAAFDPLDFNERLALSRQAVYTIGFVGFWLLGSLSSGITLLLATRRGAAKPLERA